MEQIKPTYKSSFQGVKFLVFKLGAEEYAIDILHVQEIKSAKSITQITKIPGSPPHIIGVITLHETVIPLIDLRILNHTLKDEKNFNVVMILNIHNKQVGIVVDAVIDIIELISEQIKPAPDFVSIIKKEYITGIANINEDMIMIIDVKKLLLSEELQLALHIA